MSNNHKLQKQDLSSTTADQMLELDNRELEAVAGGVPILAPVALALSAYTAFTTPEQRHRHANAIGNAISSLFD